MYFCVYVCKTFAETFVNVDQKFLIQRLQTLFRKRNELSGNSIRVYMYVLVCLCMHGKLLYAFVCSTYTYVCVCNVVVCVCGYGTGHLCMYVCMYVCIWYTKRIYVCMYVFMYVYGT